MNFKNGFTSALVIMLLWCMVGCGGGSDDIIVIGPGDPDAPQCGDLTAAAQRSLQLSDSEKAAWQKTNLYDAATDSYYLPPELFYTTLRAERGSLTCSKPRRTRRARS